MSKFMGSIKISKVSDSVIKLNAENYNQVANGSEFVIENVDHPDMILNDLNKFIPEAIHLKPNKHRNYYEIDEFSQAIDEIKRFIKGDIVIQDFKFNEKEFAITVDRYKKNPTAQLKGKVFELMMSKKYNAFVYSDLPISFLSKFGLTRVDKGIDLIDIKRKYLYQCKYTEKNLSMSDKLKRSLALCAKFQLIDSQFKLFLIVNTEANVSVPVSKSFTIIREQFIEPVIETSSLETVHESLPIKTEPSYETCYGNIHSYGSLTRTRLTIDEKAKKEIDACINDFASVYDRIQQEQIMKMQPVTDYLLRNFQTKRKTIRSPYGAFPGPNHIESGHVLKNSSRIALDKYEESDYFKTNLARNNKAEIIYKRMYGY